MENTKKNEDYSGFLGTVLDDRYTLVSIIGVGEASVVFGAYDGETGHTVALKMLKPSFACHHDTSARFITEVRVLSLFDHPNIVRILDTSFEGKFKYFVMEYVEGITLKKHLEHKGALGPGEILFFSRQILSALSEVHEKGIVHSDIKPQNIVILPSGDIKLMDFGISRTLLGQQEETSATAVGTVQYVSPEQAEGKPLEIYSDIYSFGVMLYEMATGVLPFVAEDAGQIAAMHVSDSPIPPTILNPSVSMGLQGVILRAMKKEPLDRYLSADEMLEELEVQLKKKPIQPSSARLLPQKIFFFFSSLHLPSCVAGALCALLVTVVFGLGLLGIRLTKSADYVKIPDLCGMAYTDIQSLCLDLDVYELDILYAESKTNQGTVLSQSPRANTIQKKAGGKIVISVEIAKPDFPAVMPDFCFASLDDVMTYLAPFKNAPVKVISLPHSLLPTGTVIAALPMAGTAVSAQNPVEITLFVSEEYRTNIQRVPNFAGMTKTEAKKIALDNGFALVTFSGSGTTVCSQSLAAGTAADAAGISLILSLE